MAAHHRPAPQGVPSSPQSERALARFIFASRWLQAPLYIGLIVAQAVYVVLFCRELWHLVESLLHSPNENSIMLTVLALIDVVMISNLLIMVIVGGYETFVAKLGLESHPDRPDWLSHTNENTMKIKLSLALIGISSISLLKSFIDAANVSQETLIWQSVIHVIFLVSSIAIAFTVWLSNKATQVGHEPH
ncbi:TIGR00645 family protein [Siccirubricoccus sp. KC 17139]|uniref:UPF0114 protein JYK14_19415 n=1 Tax=Siccirubricoccus soli TaxID=2899147 RepID=A0ABT1D8Q1_9PROT|nr:TIGR00645 family protein [Siccirubricoccus soli]MCO6418317.1 TIGR00645 family protein [Siccirubricoccus soli]MCP2684452.1 TIGR00645 family protein [Siccirubricoccus soli]